MRARSSRIGRPGWRLPTTTGPDPVVGATAAAAAALAAFELATHGDAVRAVVDEGVWGAVPDVATNRVVGGGSAPSGTKSRNGDARLATPPRRT